MINETETHTYHSKNTIELIKDFYPNAWNNLSWYQKVIIILLLKVQNFKERFGALIPKRRVCINCGKKFKDRQYYYKPCRNSGKTTMEAARFMRKMCCSDKCFYEQWNKCWNEVD